MKVLFLTLFSPLGGTSRIYVYQFVPLFERAGISCIVRNIYSDRFFKLQMGLVPAHRIVKKINFFWSSLCGIMKTSWWICGAWRYDVVYIQKYTMPASLYWVLRLCNPHVIYGFEDAIYETNPFLPQGRIESRLIRYQAHLFRNMVRHAVSVMTENEYLAAEAKKYNPHVFIISFPVNSARIHPVPRGRSLETVTVGWIGSPSTSYLLEGIAPVFARLAARHENVQLKVVGAALDFSMKGIGFIKKEWRLEEEYADLCSFDIGVMPLDDAPFNRGRLGGKMILYMSVGIPIVASNLGLNRTVVRHGIYGFLVNSFDEWVEALSLLVTNAALRQRLGDEGRKIAEERFSLERQADLLVKEIRAAAHSL